MRQIPLAIAVPAPRTFDNFIPGGNLPLVDSLRRLAPGGTPVYFWGPSGSGKSHLLQAAASAVQDGGGKIGWFGADVPAPWALDEPLSLVAIDDCERLDADQQQAAFSVFVAAPPALGVVAAGAVPPVDLPLRADLRSRLGWGHVFAMQPLAEAQARAALRQEADRRGVFLSDDVMDYLLTRFARDLKHLMAQLSELDRYALANKRALTVPLLKQMLATESPGGERR